MNNIKIIASNTVSAVKSIVNLPKKLYYKKSGWLYDKRYPPTKFFMCGRPKIEIQCILCGFPRCGTHWIRNVFENSTGKKTFDMFENKPSPSDTEVRLLKIHAKCKLDARAKALWLLPRHTFTGKYIYIYRNPRDAIISLYEMHKIWKNCPDLSPKEYMQRHDPSRAYRWEINNWVLRKPKDVLVVRYEDLKSNSMDTFRMIFDYLGLDVPVNIDSIDKKVAAVDSGNRPRGTVNAWMNAPSDYQHIIDTVNKKLKREIDLLGY